jgi:hypothetical protein
MSRGGRRAGAGRTPRGEAAARAQVKVQLTESEHAELLAALRDGETLAGLLREAGLREARRRPC